MGVYKIFPSQDATIYSDYNTLNTGLDSILDLSKNESNLYPSSSVCRTLIQFDNADIAEAVSKSGAAFTASLKLYNAQVDSIPTNFNIEVHPIYERWDMGTGRFANIPITTDGVSWKFRNSNQTTLWTLTGLPTGVTSSYFTPAIGGGNYYTASATQSFSYFSTKDINVDVTKFVGWWTGSVIENNGFIIMNSTSASATGLGSFEFDPSYRFQFNFFSRDTNTIYPPCLEFKWDDSIINTTNATFITDEQINIAIGNNKNTFYDNEYVKFRVYAREKYPQRVYAQTSLYKYNKVLPITSYYSIIDLNTNLRIIDFDDVATKLSIDSTSSYFKLYMNGLEPDRYYKIQIKSIIDGGTYIFDDDYYFKIMQTVE